MSLKTLINKKLISCGPEDSVLKCAQLMESENVGAVLICEGEKPVGIVTDRDIVIRCVVQSMDCLKSPVRQIMTESVHTVSVKDGIFDVIRVMRDEAIRRVPVIDENGRAVGLLSFGDIFALLGQEIVGLSAPTTPEEPKIEEQAAA